MSTWQIIAVITIIAWAFGKDLKNWWNKTFPTGGTFSDWWNNLKRTRNGLIVSIVAIIIGVHILFPQIEDAVISLAICVITFAGLGLFLYKCHRDEINNLK